MALKNKFHIIPSVVPVILNISAFRIEKEGSGIRP
jgi:hypothetical protein